MNCFGLRNSLKIRPKLEKEKETQKYIKNNPIGYGVSLQNTDQGFYLRKAKVLKDSAKELIKQNSDRNISKENISLYEVDDNVFNLQSFSLDVGLGVSKFSYMLGIKKEITEERNKNSYLLENDYKYIVTNTEIDLEPEEIWELSTEEFKEAIRKLDSRTREWYYLPENWKDPTIVENSEEIETQKPNEEELKIKNQQMEKLNSKYAKMTEDFVNKFGTHIITKCDYGYRFRKVFQTKKESVKSVNEFKIDSQMRIMEYIKFDMNYTKQKVKDFNIDSKESNVLLLGEKSNVLTKARGDELPFLWNTESVTDAEVIDVHPNDYIPIHIIIPNEHRIARKNIRQLTKEKEYELATGWIKTHNYCCVHLNMDPKLFFGEFIVDLELDPTEEKQRIVSKSSKYQTHHVEFPNQSYRPDIITIECNKWTRIDTRTDIHIKVYYKDEKEFLANIKDFNIFIPVDNHNIKRIYNLNWEEIPLDDIVKDHPGQNFEFS